MVGSLKTIKSNLKRNDIHDFKCLKDVMDFQKSYSALKQQIISQHEQLIAEEEIVLKVDLQLLAESIESQRKKSEQNLSEELDSLKNQLNILIDTNSANFFQRIILDIKKRKYKRKINQKENDYAFNVQESISNLVEIQQKKDNRFHFIKSQFSQAVQQSSRYSLSELERKKTLIDKLNPFIYGAIGEQKVVVQLESLSDDYILINDFSISFSKAIYNRQDDIYIKSVQIDHILVAPSGIFLIETKNWSEKSLENMSLRSPVDQIRRTSFVLFKLLNNELSNQGLNLNKHHWGDKKIAIKNLIVLMNSKPKEEFQFVKIVTLKELLGYVNYFKPMFSSSETQRIADFLLRINDSNII